MKLEITSPDKQIFSGDAVLVQLPGSCTKSASPLKICLSGDVISSFMAYSLLSSNIFLPFSMASSMVPTRLNAASGY